MKKFFALLLSLMLPLAAAGCGQGPQTAAEPAPAEVAEITGIDQEAAIATVGEESISFSQYQEMFNTYAGYYSMMGYDFTVEETLHEFQDFIVDMLVEEKVVAYQAGLEGYGELSQEELDEVAANVEIDLGSMMAAMEEQARSDAEADPSVNAEERLAELVADEAEYMTGTRMTYEELESWYLDYYTQSMVATNFQEDVLSGVTVSDAEIQEWYDAKAVEDQAKYQESPGSYKIDKENEELYGETPVVYAPEGYKRALHIFIAPDEDLPVEYSDKQSQMEALRGEYGTLAFEAQVLGGDDGGRLSEIADEYNALSAEADKVLEDYYAESILRAGEAYAKLEAGEDFRAVMEEYSDSVDDSEKGVLISNKHVSGDDYMGVSDWSNDIKSAFATLSAGQYTGVIRDDSGCHILYYLGDEPEGNVELSEVKESIREMLLIEAQSNEWMELMELWKNDGSVVLNEELIRSVAYVG